MINKCYSNPNIRFGSVIFVDLTKNLKHKAVPIDASKFINMLDKHKIPNNHHMVLEFENINEKHKALWIFTGKTAELISDAYKAVWVAFDETIPEKFDKAWEVYFSKFKEILSDAEKKSDILNFSDLWEKAQKYGFSRIKDKVK